LAAGLALQGASPAVGVVVAQGYFNLDNSRVYGNGTVLDGSTIRTAGVGSDVRLNSGARLRLAPESEVKVYRDRFESLGLRIAPADKSEVALAVRGNTIQIAALRGGTVVTKADGLTLARLEPGNALEFDPQTAGAAGPSTISGVLTQANGRYFVTDSTSNVTFELIGGQIDGLVGKTVVVTGTVDTGTKAATGAAQVLRVMSIKAAAGSGAATGASGMRAGTKVLIAGVVVGSTAAGIGIAKNKDKDKDKDKPPISR
jgi:hypothetical protein